MLALNVPPSNMQKIEKASPRRAKAYRAFLIRLITPIRRIYPALVTKGLKGKNEYQMARDGEFVRPRQINRALTALNSNRPVAVKANEND